MRIRPLFWIALGAGIASLTIALVLVLMPARDDARFLYISVALNLPDQNEAVAAVGQCVGQFKVSLPADGFLIVLPLRSLDSKEFICLTDKLAPVRHSMEIRSQGI